MSVCMCKCQCRSASVCSATVVEVSVCKCKCRSVSVQWIFRKNPSQCFREKQSVWNHVTACESSFLMFPLFQTARNCSKPTWKTPVDVVPWSTHVFFTLSTGRRTECRCPLGRLWQGRTPSSKFTVSHHFLHVHSYSIIYIKSIYLHIHSY